MTMKTENMGWQCPNCLVVYSPSVQKCECSVNSNKTVPLPKDYVSLSDTGVLNAEDWNHFAIKGSMAGTLTSSNKYSCALFMGKTTDGLCSKCGQPAWNHHNVSST